MRNLCIFVMLSVFSCAKKEKVEIYNKIIDENKKEVIIEIKNNTETNYYLIFPFITMYSKEGYSMETNFREGYIKNNKLDSIVCSVYIYDECCPNNPCWSNIRNRKIVLLPKKSIKRLKYEYISNNFIVDKYHLHLTYNGYSTEKNKKMYFSLKKKLDSADIIKGYEFYNEEIEVF